MSSFRVWRLEGSFILRVQYPNGRMFAVYPDGDMFEVTEEPAESWVELGTEERVRMLARRWATDVGEMTVAAKEPLSDYSRDYRDALTGCPRSLGEV